MSASLTAPRLDAGIPGFDGAPNGGLPEGRAAPAVDRGPRGEPPPGCRRCPRRLHLGLCTRARPSAPHHTRRRRGPRDDTIGPRRRRASRPPWAGRRPVVAADAAPPAHADE